MSRLVEILKVLNEKDEFDTDMETMVRRLKALFKKYPADENGNSKALSLLTPDEQGFKSANLLKFAETGEFNNNEKRAIAGEGANEKPIADTMTIKELDKQKALGSMNIKLIFSGDESSTIKTQIASFDDDGMKGSDTGSITGLVGISDDKDAKSFGEFTTGKGTKINLSVGTVSGILFDEVEDLNAEEITIGRETISVPQVKLALTIPQRKKATKTFTDAVIKAVSGADFDSIWTAEKDSATLEQVLTTNNPFGLELAISVKARKDED